MKDLKNITEFQLLTLARCELNRRIAKEQEINERTRKESGRDNRISQHRIRLYNAQLKEIQERELEIRNNNNSDEETEETKAVEGKWLDCNNEEAGCCSEDVHCSECDEEAPISSTDYFCRGGKIRYDLTPYCPHCGAIMK